MPAVIYTLCAITTSVCAWLLVRAYRRSRYRLLLWGGISFIGLSLSNLVLVADKLFLPGIDLATLRYAITLVSMGVMLYGLIWDEDER
jgi:multidrug transporter EmrE-like cation transporter